ncbi:MAG: hypothetical protein AB7V46_20445 [Thermomicrobiales bacterium]
MALAVKVEYFRGLIPKTLQKELQEKAKTRNARHIPTAKEPLEVVKEVRELLKQEDSSGTPSLVVTFNALARRQKAVAKFVTGIQEALFDIGIDRRYQGYVLEGLYNTYPPYESELEAKLYRIFGSIPEETQREQFQSEFAAFLSPHFYYIAKAIKSFSRDYRWSKRDMIYNDLPKVRGLVAEHHVKHYLDAYERATLFAAAEKGEASEWVKRALGWAGVKSDEQAAELNRVIMNGGPYDTIPKEVAPHVSRFYDYGKRFAQRFERVHPKSRLLRNLLNDSGSLRS